MSGPFNFRNSTGVSGTEKGLVCVNHTFRATTRDGRPILGLGDQICLLCNFAWTILRGELLLTPAVEIEELTFCY